MGCCLTTTANPPKPHPPPPPLPEETVKEVLSETPIIPKPHPPVPLNNSRQVPNSSAVNVTDNITVEVQENVSELYSYSESFSAATTATTMTTAADGKNDEEGEVTQKLKNKSPPVKKVVRKRPVVNSGEVPVRKERGAIPVARRHVAPSPERKRQSPARTTTNTSRYRNVGPGNDGRREGTARRSRSPAVRGETCQRRKVTEKSGDVKSADVAPVVAVESKEKSTVEKGGGEVVAEAEEVAETEVQASESLENPLVSLECFIFL